MKNPLLRTVLAISLCLLMCIACKTKKTSYGSDIYEPDTTFKVVGYLSSGNFKWLDSLELDKLTYLNLAFGNPNKDGNLVLDGNYDMAPVIKRGHENNLKVYISLAGGGRPDTTIWKSVLQPENRSAFIGKILEFVEANNLDGVDVDIEGNLLPYVGETYNPFVIELREALHAKGKGMTSALGATRIHKAISQEALEAYDFINVMVYDKTGVWRPNDIGPHSPFSYAEEAIQFWTVDKKIPPEKITLGVPFYGFDFTPPARYISFRELVNENLLNAYRDSIDMKYYNSIHSIVEKVELAKKGLGGVMIWELSYDIPGDMSLLRALDQTIKAGDCKAVTFFRDADGDGRGDPAKPFTACEAPEGYVSNMDDTDDTRR